MWRIMGLFAIREGFRLTVMSAKRALILRRMPGGVMGILGFGIVRSLMKTAKYLRKPMEYAYYLDKLVDILAQPAKEYNLSSPIVCHGYGSVISIQKYAFLESQDERCLVNLERNVEITLKEHRKKMQDEGYRKDFSI